MTWRAISARPCRAPTPGPTPAPAPAPASAHDTSDRGDGVVRQQLRPARAAAATTPIARANNGGEYYAPFHASARTPTLPRPPPPSPSPVPTNRPHPTPSATSRGPQSNGMVNDRRTWGEARHTARTRHRHRHRHRHAAPAHRICAGRGHNGINARAIPLCGGARCVRHVS